MRLHKKTLCVYARRCYAFTQEDIVRLRREDVVRSRRSEFRRRPSEFEENDQRKKVRGEEERQ
jgi:hypothetical protein